MIKAIIFDLWGTLFYDQCKVKHPFIKFAEKLGQNFNDYNYMKIFEKHLMLKKYYNLKIPVKNILKELNIPEDKELISELAYLLEKKEVSPKPYPEVLKVLKILKERGYKLGLLTNTYYHAYKQLNERFKINSLFDVAIKSYEIGILKPDPKIFELSINKLKVKKNEALMVGDSLEDDIKPAEKFGIKAVLIDRKNKYPTYKKKITSLKELNNILNL